MAALGDVIVNVGANVAPLAAGMATARAEMDATGKSGMTMGGALATGAKAVGVIGLAAGVAGAAAADMAAKFETLTTQIVTGAGESEAKIGMVRQGILQMAGEVGAMPDALAKGLYNIESAGFHGAAGLELLRVAAEGAKVGGAEMATVADVLTSALNAYKLPASDAVEVTNTLIATVAAGKMHMEDLAGSLGTVLAPAALAGISLQEVGAAVSTMTMQGTSAQMATTYVRQMVNALAGAGNKNTIKGLESIGLTISGVANTIKKQPDGFLVALNQINMGLDTKFPQSAKVMRDELAKVKAGLETEDEAFANLSENASPEFINAMKLVAGSSRTMMGMMELTGPSAGVLRANFEAISAAADDSSGSVKGWNLVQETLNAKLDKAAGAAAAVAIQVGNALLPVLGPVADGAQHAAQFIGDVVTELGKAGGASNTATPAVSAVAGILRDVGTFVSHDVLPALSTMGDVLFHVGTFILPPVVSAFGFLASNLWIVEAASAAWLARLVEIKAINMVAWVVGMTNSFRAMAGVQGIGAATQALAGLGGAGGISGALRGVAAAGAPVPMVFTKTGLAIADAGKAGKVAIPAIEGLAAPLAQTEGSAVKATGALAGAGLGMGSLALVGIPLLIGAGVALALNWDSVTKSVHGFFDPAFRASEAIKDMNKQLAAGENLAASAWLQGLTSDAKGFFSALSQGAAEADPSLASTLASMNADTSWRYWHVGETTKQVTKDDNPIHSYKGLDANAIAGQKADDAKRTAADVKAATAADLDFAAANEAASKTVSEMKASFGGLSPIVQNSLNYMIQSTKGMKDQSAAGRFLATMYTGLKGVQDNGLPTWDAQGNMVGVVTGKNDQFLKSMQHIADTTTGEQHAAAMQAIADYQAQGGAIGILAGQMTSALGPWQQMHDQLVAEATAHGDSQAQAEAHAKALADKLYPAGALMNDTIQAMTDKYNALHPGEEITLQDEQLLVANNPPLLQAYLDVQGRLDSWNKQVQASADAWDAMTGAQRRAFQLNAAEHPLVGAQPPSGPQGAHGAVTNAPATGQNWVLHGVEAIVPRDRATPWLWSAMMDTLAGKTPTAPTSPLAGAITSSGTTSAVGRQVTYAPRYTMSLQGGDEALLRKVRDVLTQHDAEFQRDMTASGAA